jgi:hypothetical protein
VSEGQSRFDSMNLLYLEFLSNKFAYLIGILKSLMRHLKWNSQARLANNDAIIFKPPQVIAQFLKTFIHLQA